MGYSPRGHEESDTTERLTLPLGHHRLCPQSALGLLGLEVRLVVYTIWLKFTVIFYEFEFNYSLVCELYSLSLILIY